MGSPPLPRAAPEEAGFDPAVLARIGPRLQSYMDEKRFTGFSTLVARLGRVVHFEQRGWQDPEARVPMGPDTIFRVYSMTKPVVCAALMTLYDEGRFRLDDPVSRYIPAFGQVKVLSGRRLADARLEALERPITIEHLLTHTSGLTYGFLDSTAVSELYRQSPPLNDSGLSLAAMVDELARLPLAWQPGSRWSYGLSIDVAARIAEIISDKPLQDFLAERVFRPVGMEDSGFFVPEGKRRRVAAMYGNPDIGTTPSSKSFHAWRSGYYERIDVEATHPSGSLTFARGGHGLFSTAADYFRFAQMLLDRGQARGRRVLKPETVDLMHANHLPARVLPIDLGGIKMPGCGFGLGSQVLLDVEASGLPGSVGEYGWGGAAKTRFWVAPRLGIVAVILAQYMSGFDYPEDDFKRLVYEALAGGR